MKNFNSNILGAVFGPRVFSKIEIYALSTFLHIRNVEFCEAVHSDNSDNMIALLESIRDSCDIFMSGEELQATVKNWAVVPELGGTFRLSPFVDLVLPDIKRPSKKEKKTNLGTMKYLKTYTESLSLMGWK